MLPDWARGWVYIKGGSQKFDSEIGGRALLFLLLRFALFIQEGVFFL